jgi:hypothetical protein
MPYRMASAAAPNRALLRHSIAAPPAISQVAAMYAKIVTPGMWSPQGGLVSRRALHLLLSL